MRGWTSTTIIGVGVLVAAIIGMWRHVFTDGQFETMLAFAGTCIAVPQKLADPRVFPKLNAIEDATRSHTEEVATKLDVIEDVARAHTDAIAANGGKIADVQRRVTGMANALATKL